MPSELLRKAGQEYAKEVASHIANPSATEETYYPAIRNLLAAVLSERVLPFRPITGTSEQRGRPGRDRPDVALYETGDFAAVTGEVKLPDVGIKDMAASTDREDQIGRYLAQTGVVLLCNVRSIGLLATKQGHVRKPGVAVSVANRDLRHVVDLWPLQAAMAKGRAIEPEALEAVADLIEQAVTEFAPVADPASLARILARLARRAKADLPDKFESVGQLLKDYEAALGLTFEDEKSVEFFRSLLIQTAFYGLFAGWTLWHRAVDGTEFEWERIERYLKIPFLGKLFYEFKHPDRLAELKLTPHLDRAAAVLGRVERTAFFKEFTYADIGAAAAADASAVTAITYFYEPFLEAFDPDLRKELGVWYTPPDVVRYQVRRIEELLKSELGCAKGFADERVVVLDPCCGTGTYLLEVVRRIAAEHHERGDDAVLPAHLLEAVCTRILGFEILTAPFVIAQLQLYLALADIGSAPNTQRRPAIFLTNALTGWEGAEPIKLNFPELQQEHDSAKKVKREAKIIVILGNPPYNRFADMAIDEEADLVDHYKGVTRKQKKDKKTGKPAVDKRNRPVLVQVGESLLFKKWKVRKQLLDDLYIRFFRLAEKRIGEKAEHGIVSYISNSSYLTGRSHPIMRGSLLANFHEIWIDNLNGDKYRTGKVIPEGLPDAGKSDQSIFTTPQDPRGIQPGTCIATLLKRGPRKPAAKPTVHYRDFWGLAQAKRRALLESLGWPKSKAEQKAAAARPEGPREFEVFEPTEARRWILAPQDSNAGYEAWPAIDDLFPEKYQGVNPNRGHRGSVMDRDKGPLAARMQDYFNAKSFAALKKTHPAFAEDWARYEPEDVWKRLKKESGFKATNVVPYLLFPYDLRWLYFEEKGKLLNEKRPEFFENLADNEFLITVPEPRQVSETRPMFSRILGDLHVHDRGSVYVPVKARDHGLFKSVYANLANSVWERLQKDWKLKGVLEDPPAIETVLSLFRLALAMIHSPRYEREHADSLAHDWAHLPIPKDKKLLGEIAAAGKHLEVLLDARSDADPVVAEILGKQRLKFLGPMAKKGGGAIAEDDLRVTIPYFSSGAGKWVSRPYATPEEPLATWGASTGDLFINDTVFFSNVPEAAWRYELGGYPVLKKWLGSRQGDRNDDQHLSLKEAQYFRSIIQRIATIRALHPQIDELYDRVSAANAAYTAEELGIPP